MDQNALVEGQGEGIRRISRTLRSEGFDVEASYLVRRVSMADDDPEWVLVFVIPHFGPRRSRELIYKLVDLRRAGRLPFVDPRVRLEGVPPDHVEASRLLAYLRGFDHSPPVVQDVGLSGLLIDYAVIGEDGRTRAHAA